MNKTKRKIKNKTKVHNKEKSKSKNIQRSLNISSSVKSQKILQNSRQSSSKTKSIKTRPCCQSLKKIIMTPHISDSKLKLTIKYP